VVLEGVHSHSCVRSNWREVSKVSFGGQNQNKSDGRMRRSGRPREESCGATGSLAVQLSSGIFQANDNQLQIHIRSQI